MTNKFDQVKAHGQKKGSHTSSAETMLGSSFVNQQQFYIILTIQLLSFIQTRQKQTRVMIFLMRF